LSNFDAWCNAFVEGKETGRFQIKRGRSLALKRLALFKDLLALDPEEALKRAVPIDVYRRLPASIQQHIEQRVSAYGDFMVSIAMTHDHHSGEMTGSRVYREVIVGGVHYPAIVYGRRETMTTKLNIPIQGIIVDGSMILDEEPLRRLTDSEFKSLCPGAPSDQIVAEVGGQLMTFANPSALQDFAREQIEWESKIGPIRPTDADPQSPWTLGAKTVLFIRVDFSDAPGDPISMMNNELLTEARAQALIDNEVNSFYVNNSYNQTSLKATVTPVIRMPQTQSYYAGASYTVLFSDAETAARAAGYDIDNFNLYLIGMSGSDAFSYGGLGYVGSRGVILNGAFVMYAIAHELGHNYGLWHANQWITTDGSVIGPGYNWEYGNGFDVMGQGGDARGHFGANYKRRLDWLTDANVQTVTTDGIYRLFAHDSTIPGGIRALKIRKGSTKNYWIEFRQLSSDSSAFNGALLTWDYESKNYQENEILDMAPSTTDSTDGALRIGQTFDDTEDHIRITALGKGHTVPESIDLKVELNVGCDVTFNQTSQTFSASGGEGTFSISALTGCLGPATTNDSWITGIQLDGGIVKYLVAANYDAQARTGMITIAGKAFTVQQGGSQTACAAHPLGMVAWWRGEGNALDQTGVNNGTIPGNINFTGGQIGGAFRGSSTGNWGYVEVPDSPSLNLDASMTIEFWIRIDSPWEGTVIERRAPGFRDSYRVFLSSNNSLSFNLFYDASTGAFASLSSDPIPTNQFVHFAVTVEYNGARTVKLYVNGSLDRVARFSQNPLNQGDTYFGNINGVVDELSLYNRALDASEIAAIYNAGVAATGGAGKCLAAPAPSQIQFSSDNYSVSENAGVASVTVTRTGDTSLPATVGYETADNTNVQFDCSNPGADGQFSYPASRKCDYHIASGRLRFSPGETSRQIPISIVNDVYVEHSEALSLSLIDPTGASLGPTRSANVNINDDDSSGQANPIDATPFFVRMLYVDLLSREPDPAGYAGWIHRIDFCGQPGEPPPPCDRVTVGGDGFLRSSEFFDREFFVVRLYRTALGRIPRYDDVRDIALVSGFLTASDLEENKLELLTRVMAQEEFMNIYGGLNHAQFVDKLIQTAGVTIPNADRNGWVNALNGATKSRARVFRELSERTEISTKYLHEAQVVSCYYGFFTRNPDAAYLDFLQRLDSGQINLGDLANAFIYSSEYRRRFGP